MTKIIAISNFKGGVGKTTSTVNIGAALALAGKKVLLIDLDPQFNLTRCLGIKPEKSIYGALKGDYPPPIVERSPNLHLLPSALELIKALVARSPDDVDLRVLEARVAEWSGDLDLALKDWMWVAAHRPGGGL